MDTVTADRAERLVRHRATIAIALGTLLAATQGLRMDKGGEGPVGWAVTGVIVAIFLLWASGIFRGKALRGIVNDEGSDANRRRSLVIAFWNMIVTAILCYALTYVKDFGPRDAIQIILAVGMSSALIGFGFGERIAMRS